MRHSVEEITSYISLVLVLVMLASCGGGNNASPDPGGTNPPPPTSFTEMCNQNGVIFCDDFENGLSGWIPDGGDSVLISGGAIASEGATILELRTYQGQHSSKLLKTFANQDLVYIRYDVRYASDYDNSGGSHGSILGGSMAPPYGMLGTAGKKPNGSDHFTLNSEPIGTVGIDGQFGFYAYFTNMQPDGRGDYWGNVFTSTQPSPATISLGQWYCVEFGLQLNTPGNNVDGLAWYWVDNILHRTVTNLQWRIDAGLGINTFSLDSYNHFTYGARPANSPNRVQYDNVVISTSPIGCL